MKWLIKTNGCNHSSFNLETIQYKHTQYDDEREHSGKQCFCRASKSMPRGFGEVCTETQ